MENYASLIAILLQHSQRFLDFWNLHIVISLAMIGFLFSNPAPMIRRPLRLFVSLIFIGIAAFSIFSLSVHQQREELLWIALEASINAETEHYLPEEIAYITTPNAGSSRTAALPLGKRCVSRIGAIMHM